MFLFVFTGWHDWMQVRKNIQKDYISRVIPVWLMSSEGVKVLKQSDAAGSKNWKAIFV